MRNWLRSSLLGATTSATWSKGNTPKFVWNRAGLLFSAENLQSLKRGKIGPREGQYALCFKTRASFGAHHEFQWRDLCRQRRRCSPITNDSSFWQYKVYSQEFPGEGASNDSGVIENVDFQSFQMQCLRHLRKWGQCYYIVLLSPLSPFHWPQNTWPWMTLNVHFTWKFHYYEPQFQ